MSTEASHMRADARQNRDRIVEVAHRLFGERGLDVPMAAIARHAGVGIATLYRRFPTREALVTAVFAEHFSTCLSVVDEALSDPDPWCGFRSIVERVCSMQAADRGFSRAVIASFPDALDLGREQDRAMDGLNELVRRAKRTGRLRADFAVEDLALLFMANNGIISDHPDITMAASRRLVAYMLNTFRADHADPSQPLPPPAALELRHVFRGQTKSGP